MSLTVYNRIHRLAVEAHPFERCDLPMRLGSESLVL